MAKPVDPGQHYMTKERDEIEIALEDLDFIWCRSELKEMRKMWNEGKCLYDMAYHFDRKEEEVFMALLHLSRNGRIKKRVGGVY